MVNILILSHNLNRASFRQRIGIYTDILRANGIQNEAASFQSSPWARWKMFQRCACFDAVFLQKKTLNFLDAMWLRRYAKKIIFDFDDAVMYDDKHPERRPSRLNYTKPFERTVRLADVVIAGNAYLAEHARRFNTNVKILHTGLDTKSYKPRNKPQNDGRLRLVWIGSKTTLRYLAKMKPALEQIGSKFDNVVLKIICDQFLDLQNMVVEKQPWSLETQAKDLAASDIGLAPLPDNRFTRGKCGFKILQYAATGLPVVASPVGVNVEYVKDGITGLLATDIQQWIEKISLLIENPELSTKMGMEGQAHAKNFDLSVVGKQLIELITECLSNVTS